MVKSVESAKTPWVLGEIEEGYEWFAFTFQDQPQIQLSSDEIAGMVDASDQVTLHAYSRMDLGGSGHIWASHTQHETSFILKTCEIKPGQRLLDLGCGIGRHSLELAEVDIDIVAVDYIENFLIEAKKQQRLQKKNNVKFIFDDCRNLEFTNEFDAAICLYDVVGSFVNDEENLKIISTIHRALKSGGTVLISVMNYEVTRHYAQHFFSLNSEPDKLLDLPASKTMETTGNIFNPDLYMIDRDTRIVYRKEQFSEGTELPTELIVRDRRYTEDEIVQMCQSAGLQVLWSRFVQAGHWETALAGNDRKAKEILLFCKKVDH